VCNIHDPITLLPSIITDFVVKEPISTPAYIPFWLFFPILTPHRQLNCFTWLRYIPSGTQGMQSAKFSIRISDLKILIKLDPDHIPGINSILSG
jgi:hypothetical protein